MKFIDLKIYNAPSMPRCEYPVYGYQHENDQTTYWSMTFYNKTWSLPMHPDLISPKLLENYDIINLA